jgi:hypothetical protein
MIRGTTPTHTFELPFDTAVIKKIKIIYAQNDKVLFCKEAEACSLNARTVTVKLTQNETLLFDCDKLVQIQMRILTTTGEALASGISVISISKCLENEVFE